MHQGLLRVATAILTEMNCEGTAAEERHCVLMPLVKRCFMARLRVMGQNLIDGQRSQMPLSSSVQNLRADIPTVIFETAWSESYEDLKIDMRQWLQHSGSNV